MSDTKTEIKPLIPEVKIADREVQDVKKDDSEVADKDIITNGNCAQEKDENERRGTKRKNQFGDDDDSYMSVDIWRKRWRKGQTKFHMGEVHPALKKHYAWLTKDEEKKRFFLPLCGKSLDLKWLADKGNEVVGNEAASEAVTQFFENHDLEYTVEPIQKVEGHIYKAKDLHITIYCCDFFEITPEIVGTFDAVWDRGSLAAIHPDDREKYAKVFQPMLKKDGRCLLDLFQVDHAHFIGPPYTFLPISLQELYGKMKVERVSSRDARGCWQKEWGVAYFIQDIYYVTWKSDDQEACQQ